MRPNVPRRRIGPFRLPAVRAILSGCPDRALFAAKTVEGAPASASCPTISISASSPGRASAGRPNTNLRHGGRGGIRTHEGALTPWRFSRPLP